MSEKRSESGEVARLLPPKGYCEVFMAHVAMCERLGVSRIQTTQPGGVFVYQVDDNWWTALNANKAAVKIPDSSRGGLGGSEVEVPPFTLYVAWNGFPAGLLDPFGGTLAAGEAANGDALIAALNKVKAHD